jgi:hypothetical protein
MAFLRRGIGDNDSDINSGSLPREILSAARWVAIPCVVVFFASWSAATLAGLHSATTRIQAGSFLAASLPVPLQIMQSKAVPQPARTRVLGPTAERKVARLFQPARIEKPVANPLVNTPVDPFAKIVAEAKLSRAKLVTAFASAGMVVADDAARDAVAVASYAAPIAARFQSLTDEVAATGPDAQLSPMFGPTGLKIELAYASVETSPRDPVQLAMATLGDDPLDIDMGLDANPDSVDEAAPEQAAVPPAKPQAAPRKPEPEPAQAADEPAAPPSAPARKPGASPRQEPQALAYARPDNPTDRAFGKLFKTPNRADKVAIYDISAAVVHMPDGTKLEAHSGIGKMADNPRYVHVKMRGPTPPNTYKLTMREKLFHGVEAIRMTPVGEQTMHGRDGMLAHSYLLRGRREQSHGCVAFANYPKFLEAFKQGRITHMIVVPSMSKAKVQMVSSGRGT